MEPLLSGAPTLEQLTERFTEWRLAKTRKRSAVPADLWAEATRIALSTSVGKVAKTLGLNSTSLRKKVRALTGGPTTYVEEPTFVRANLGSIHGFRGGYHGYTMALND